MADCYGGFVVGERDPYPTTPLGRWLWRIVKWTSVAIATLFVLFGIVVALLVLDYQDCVRREGRDAACDTTGL